MVEENKIKEEIKNKTEDEKIVETKVEEKSNENKIKDKDEKVGEKKEKKEKIKKTEAHLDVQNARISTKQSIAICDWIRGKKIDDSIFFLEEVVKKKKALPMKGEIPHRKGRIQSGRFPMLSSLEFIKFLKSLKANAIQNGIDVDKAKISRAISNIGNRPLKRGGREKAKRTHIYIQVEEPKKEGSN